MSRKRGQNKCVETIRRQAMDRLERLKEVLRDNDLLGEQCFDCESLVGDHRETIYDEDGIKVLVCYYYEYVEILGLSDDEYQSITEKKSCFRVIRRNL